MSQVIYNAMKEELFKKIDAYQAQCNRRSAAKDSPKVRETFAAWEKLDIDDELSSRIEAVFTSATEKLADIILEDVHTSAVILQQLSTLTSSVKELAMDQVMATASSASVVDGWSNEQFKAKRISCVALFDSMRSLVDNDDVPENLSGIPTKTSTVTGVPLLDIPNAPHTRSGNGSSETVAPRLWITCDDVSLSKNYETGEFITSGRALKIADARMTTKFFQDLLEKDGQKMSRDFSIKFEGRHYVGTWQKRS